MNMTPIIGITTYRNPEDGGHYLPGGYAESVYKAGGIPVLLASAETDIDRILEAVDGLIFAGGGDIDPAVYDGPPYPSIDRVDPVRDRFEFELAERVFNSTTPVLGICRGFQLLALASGSRLITHIPDEIGEEVIHRAVNGDSIKHFIEVEHRSRLAIITGSTKFEVESKHHQAIREISDDWRIIAKADDGLIEGIEHKRHPWMISVLWHPEMSLDEEIHQNIFRALVEATRVR
jgi:putative glutamine amidotransferase